MIEAYLDGAGEVIAHLGSLNDQLTEELRKSVARLTIKLQKRVVTEKLAGQVLGVRTGRGRRSIQQTTYQDGNRVVGVVSTNLFYMVGWETGWPGAQERGLKAAKAKFDIGASADTFKNGTPKQRAFLVPSLKEMQSSGEIARDISAGIGRAVT